MKKILLLIAFLQFLNANIINSIDFEGLKYLSKTSAKNISGLDIMQELTPQNANTAIKNLYKQGYFKQIQMDFNNGNLVFKMTEKPSVAKISIVGISKNDKKQLKDFLDLKVGDIFDESTANASNEKIKIYYQAKGFFGTAVKYAISKVNENSVSVEFKVNRGEAIIIKDVSLVGAKYATYGDIEEYLSNPSRDFLGFLWGFNDGKLKLNELPQDSFAIEEYYKNKGFLDVGVSKAYLKTDFDDYSAKISYFIEEGNRYKVRNIDINYSKFIEKEGEQNAKKLPQVKDLSISKKAYASYKKINKDIKLISDEVSNFGYAYVDVQPDIKRINENQIDIVFNVIPYQKVYINEVIIKGNSKTVDRVIRREMYLNEGHLYSKIDLEDSKNALKRTGYFEDVSIKQRRVSDDKVDLIVEVKETNTGSITGGIGYGSSDGLLLNFGISENNIFGGGFSGDFNIDKSKKSLLASVSLSNPRLYDSRWFLSNSFYVRKYNWDNYDERNTGYSIDFGRGFWRYFGVGLNYTIEKSELKDVKSLYIKTWFKENALKSALTPYIYVNNTDDYYLPRSGISSKISTEFAGLKGDVRFIKTSFKYAQFLSPYYDYDIDVIFRFKVNFDKIWEKGYTPINERLYLGGIGRLRGYESRSVAPISPFDKDDRIGGFISGLGIAELNFPIINKLKLRGSLFYDYGMIGEKKLNEIKRSSYGAVIEWTTPMGPLQFIFSKPIDNKEDDKVSRFEFTIGNRF